MGPSRRSDRSARRPPLDRAGRGCTCTARPERTSSPRATSRPPARLALGRPPRRDDHDGCRAHGVGDEQQEVACRLVGPVQVLDDDDERLRPAAAATSWSATQPKNRKRSAGSAAEGTSPGAPSPAARWPRIWANGAYGTASANGRHDPARTSAPAARARRRTRRSVATCRSRPRRRRGRGHLRRLWRAPARCAALRARCRARRERVTSPSGSPGQYDGSTSSRAAGTSFAAGERSRLDRRGVLDARCERASASERVSNDGLRGRGTQEEGCVDDH